MRLLISDRTTQRREQTEQMQLDSMMILRWREVQLGVMELGASSSWSSHRQWPARLYLAPVGEAADEEASGRCSRSHDPHHGGAPAGLDGEEGLKEWKNCRLTSWFPSSRGGIGLLQEDSDR
jgi:hypothetical protein